MRVRKRFYRIGVYDPEIFESWPYGDFCDDMVYLSAKKRLCKEGKAIEFECKTKAREFYAEWMHRNKYKMELKWVERNIDVPEPEYPENHPNSIMKRIRENESHIYSYVLAQT